MFKAKTPISPPDLMRRMHAKSTTSRFHCPIPMEILDFCAVEICLPSNAPRGGCTGAWLAGTPPSPRTVSGSLPSAPAGTVSCPSQADRGQPNNRHVTSTWESRKRMHGTATCSSDLLSTHRLRHCPNAVLSPLGAARLFLAACLQQQCA